MRAGEPSAISFRQSAPCARRLPADGGKPGAYVVGRAGFEPAKRGARQIYSLLPLTTRPSPHGHALRGKDRVATESVLEPERGLEPLTCRLQIGCAASCATRARVRDPRADPNTKTIRRGGPRSKYGASIQQWQAIGVYDRCPRAASRTAALKPCGHAEWTTLKQAIATGRQRSRPATGRCREVTRRRIVRERRMPWSD